MKLFSIRPGHIFVFLRIFFLMLIRYIGKKGMGMAVRFWNPSREAR
jgi:hypothetical protein